MLRKSTQENGGISMNRNSLKNNDLIKILRSCLESKRENEFFDLKLEWHEKMEDLVKDIICFSNTVHDRNCFIFFGISDNFEIVGLNDAKRIKQADIVDTISKLHFAGPERPSFEVKSLLVNNKEIDVLVIYNIEKTPIFLEKHYGKMRAGCIYSREIDRNTPDNANATFPQIEALWRKRFGLRKSKKTFLFELLENKKDWDETYPEYYNVFLPEYRVRVIEEDNNNDRDEFYSYAMDNEKTNYYQIELIYNSNKLDSFQGVSLDSGRLFIPTATWGFIRDKEFPTETICRYKYYIKGSEEDKLLNFFYDNDNDEQRYAFRNISDIFLFYENEGEQLSFEKYLENNVEKLTQRFNSITRYNYLCYPEGEKNRKLELYREDLHYSLAMKQLLQEWRKNNYLSTSLSI